MAESGEVLKSKKPSCVKADQDLANFISLLEEGCYLLKITNNGLDTLKENMFAGEKVERNFRSVIFKSMG